MKTEFSARRFAAAISLYTLIALGALAFSAPPHAEETAPSEAKDVKKEGYEKDRNFAAAMERRQKELDDREDALRVREERLNALKNDISERAAELNRLHGKLDALVKKLDDADGERVRRIVKIYESMTPEEVASRIEKLDEQTSVLILSIMSEKKAAKILGLVSVERSVRLTQALKLKKD